MSMELDKEEVIKLFEEVFRHSGGAVKTCECGKTYYNPDGGWTWEDGEIEALEESGATAVDYSIGDIEFGYGSFADACDCWHEKAMRIYNGITSYDREITELLARRSVMLIEKAREAATVQAALQSLLPAGTSAEWFAEELNIVMGRIQMLAKKIEHA
jgi:hypothetical protein